MIKILLNNYNNKDNQFLLKKPITDTYIFLTNRLGSMGRLHILAKQIKDMFKGFTNFAERIESLELWLKT